MTRQYRYSWAGYSRVAGSGQNAGIQHGILTAGGESEVKARLYRQGIVVQHVSRRRSRLPQWVLQAVRPGKGWPPRRTVSDGALLMMVEQLASLSKAGLPLDKSLEICRGSCSDRHLGHLLSRLRDDVMAGTPLHQAMDSHRRCFDALAVNLVKAGETAGKLDAMLDRLADTRRRQIQTHQQIRKSLRYPAIVLTVAIVVTAILLTRVVPGFASSFEQLGAELPQLTQHVMAVSAWVSSNGPTLLLLTTPLLLLSGLLVRRNHRARHLFHHLLLRLPWLSGAVRAACLSRLSDTLTTALRSGLPLVEALRLAAPTAGNDAYQAAVDRIRDSVSHGLPLSECIRNQALFPVMIVQMITAGEEAGTLDTMLGKCATYYQQELDTRVEQLTTLLEPCLMAAMGVIVGVLMLAMYLPIFNLGSAL